MITKAMKSVSFEENKQNDEAAPPCGLTKD
jgi:hypothetical protein